MTWENYAIDIGSCYYLTKHYWQLKLLKFLDATFKKQCTVLYNSHEYNKVKISTVHQNTFYQYTCMNY